MKFTTATALFAISASIVSAAPAYTQVSSAKAVTSTTSSADVEPTIILDYYTVTSVSVSKTSKTHGHEHHETHSHTKTGSTTAPSAVSILPVGQASIFIPSGISIFHSVPTTIVSDGKTTTSEVGTVSFLHFGPGPVRFTPRTSSTTPSSTVASYTSTPVVEQHNAESTSSGLPFTLHFGFPAQATIAKPSYTSSSSSVASHSAPSSYSAPAYKSTVYSTIYVKPTTISVHVPGAKSTVTSIVTVPGTKHTVTSTEYYKPTVASSSVKSSVTPEAYKSASSASSVSSSASTSVGLPFTLHYGFPMQHSTLVTSVIKATPIAASYSTTSYIKSTPIAAYTSATPSTVKNYITLL